jgi:transcriptional regulator with XRE-family HTH domain
MWVELAPGSFVNLDRLTEVSFGRRLKAHRLAAKVTQQDLARKTGLHWMVLSRLERDHNPPDWPTLTRLLAVLGLRLLQVPPVPPVPLRRQPRSAER